MRVLLLLSLTLGVPVAAQELVVSDFDSATPLAGWHFDLGDEFPGAQGSMTAGEGRSGGGLVLSYDFGGGGRYVAALHPLSPTREARGVSFWVRAGPNVGVSARVVDGQEQTFQHGIPRRPFAVDTERWFRQSFEISATHDFWGGPANGSHDGQAKLVQVIAGAPSDPAAGTSGTVAYDDVWLLSEIAPRLDPWETAVQPVPGSGGLRERLGTWLSGQESDAALDAAKEAGFGWATLPVEWAAIETEAGSYDFATLDGWIERLAARELRPQLVLRGPHPVHSDGAGQAPRSQVTRAAFASFARAVAERYAGRGFRYELWHRPDSSSTWAPAPDATQFAELVRAAGAAIRSVDASAEIVSGAAQSHAFIRSALGAGLGQAVDGIGFTRAGSPEHHTTAWLALRSIVGVSGTDRPLWATARSYSSASSGQEGDALERRNRQAREVVREMLVAWALGEPLFAYDALVDRGTAATVTRENEGLLTAEGERKPALDAVQTLAEHARGRELLGAYDLVPSTLHALKLEGSADVVLALWLASSRGAVDVALPTPHSAVDALGEPVATVLEDGRPGVRVESARAPVYLVYPSANDGGGGVEGPRREGLLGWGCTTAGGPSLPALLLVLVARRSRLRARRV